MRSNMREYYNEVLFLIVHSSMRKISAHNEQKGKAF